MIQDPPSMPSMPKESLPLVEYLRRFSSWAFQSISGAVTTTTAVPSILLISPGGKVFKVSVSDAGALVVTAIPLGGGSATV